MHVEILDNPEICARIVELIAQGDPSGVEELYGLLSAPVRSILARFVDAGHIEDGLHEVVVVVLNAIRGSSLRDPARLGAFARRVAQRQAVAYLRQTIFRRRRFVSVSLREPHAPWSQSPEARLARREARERLERALRRLRPRDREILERFYLREQHPAQICGEMHITGTQFRLFKSRAIARCSSMEGSRRAACA
jgi:RNA polymerase sigma factor (sigma-70 family)